MNFFTPDIFLHVIRLSVPLGYLIKQAGIIIRTILHLWETPGIEPVTSGLTSVEPTRHRIYDHEQNVIS